MTQQATYETTSTETTEPFSQGPDTVPLFGQASDTLRNTFGEKARGWFGGRKQSPTEDKRSAIERMRDKVAEFDEDYKDAGERLLGFFMSFIGYIGPFLLVL